MFVKEVLGFASHIAQIAAAFAVIIGGVAFLTLGSSDPFVIQRFSFFIATRVWFDILVLGLMAAVTGYLIFTVAGFRSDVLRSIATTRPSSRALTAVVVALSLAWPAYFFVRARQYFWTELLRQAYAIDVLQEVERRASQGRIVDAYERLGVAVRVLNDSPEVNTLRVRLRDIETLIKRSGELSSRVSLLSARAWNPVGDSETYFRLAEAVRVNPQNSSAAEALREMRTALEKRALASDIQRFCGAGSKESDLLTISRAERDVLIAQIEKAVERKDECRSLLTERWRLGYVDCILAVSEHVRVGTDRDEHAVSRPSECKSIEFASLSRNR